MNKLITIIVPVYNIDKYLEKCVNSIQGQTYKNLEIILVDDGSTDSSGLLCDSLAAEDSRIRVIHKPNGGLSSARNAGLDISTGDYIGFIDSDDYIATDFYESLLALSRNERTVLCSHFVRVDESGNITYRNDPHIEGGEISAKDYIRELLLHIGDVSVCSKLFPRHAVEDLRFDETRLNEDLLFMMELIPRIETISFTDKIGYYYLCRANSISSKYGKAIEDMVGNSVLFKNKVLAIYPELRAEADRFALFQHMAYLLLVPSKLRNKSNALYIQAIRYLRRNFFVNGLTNRYLTAKNKLIMLGQIFAPSMLASKYQKKHK